MITGASQADAAVLIIDALEGVRDQTPATAISCICSASSRLRWSVNKMDRVDFAQVAVQGDRRRNLGASDRAWRDAHGGDPDLRA